MEELKRLLAKCDAQLVEIEKGRMKTGAHKIQKPPPKRRPGQKLFCQGATGLL
jgi:hypothetical protein